jgi:hypothetical protein
MRELQMWCSAPLPEGEIQRRKLRSDKNKPPAGRLLENYESDSSVEADEDTDVEAGADPVVGAAKSRRRTRLTVVKKSASAVATAISAVKAAEQKKKRKRRAASPLAVATPMIPTPRLREVGSEDEEEEKEKEKDEAVEELPVPEAQEAERPESPAAKRQRELVQKTSEEALRCGLEAQRSAAATRAKIPAAIKPRVFWPKTRLPDVSRYGLNLDGIFPCRPAARAQGVPITPSSPSRTSSPEPQVTGEALVDDARIAAPTRGLAEGGTTSPPVTDTRAGSSLHTAEGVDSSVGVVGATTSPTIVDVDPSRVVPDGAKDVAEDRPQIDLAPGGPGASGAQVPPSSTSSLRLPRRSINWDHTPWQDVWFEDNEDMRTMQTSIVTINNALIVSCL